MALTWEEIESLGLTWGQWESLDMTWGELDNKAYDEVVRDVIKLKIDNRDYDFWDKFSVAIGVNNRFTEFKLLSSHEKLDEARFKIDELHGKITEQVVMIGDLKAELEKEKGRREKAEQQDCKHRIWNYVLAGTSILFGAISVIALFF